MSKNVSEMLNGMDDEQLRQFYDKISLIADDLGRALIGKIAGPHTPLSVDDLPWNGFDKGETLDRLYRLEDESIFESKMEKKDNGYVRVFYATETAKRLAEKVSLPELATK